jgi:predicted transcriptional regulator
MTTVTLELDDDLVADLRADAERTGRSVDQVAADRLRRGRTSVIDRLWARNDMGEDEAMQLALDEIQAMRTEKTQQ